MNKNVLNILTAFVLIFTISNTYAQKINSMILMQTTLGDCPGDLAGIDERKFYKTCKKRFL